MAILASNPTGLELPFMILIGLGCCISFAAGFGLILSSRTAIRMRGEKRDVVMGVGVLLILIGAVPVVFAGLAWCSHLSQGN